MAHTCTTTLAKNPLRFAKQQQQDDTSNHHRATLRLLNDEHNSIICPNEKYSPVSIHIKTDAYPEEVSWRLESNGEIIDEIQQGYYDQANHLYTHEVCVSAKECFGITIEDAFGDGVCCSHGDGYFNVMRDDEVIFSGDEFGYEISETYCLSSLGEEEEEEEKEYEVKKFVASDGKTYDFFGSSCSMSDDLVVIGAPWVDGWTGAAYLLHLNGTEVKKLTPGNDGQSSDYFGASVSIDEKIVVGKKEWGGSYVRVFSREGIYERTLTCDDCSHFGDAVATLGNLTVTNGEQDSISKQFIYSTEEGQLLKTLEQGSDTIFDLSISEKFIVSTSETKTIIYSNTSPDFPKITEINQGGYQVAVSDDRIVVGDPNANNYDGQGAAYLYKTDGTLVTILDRQDAPSGSLFGASVDITDDKVLVSVPDDDEQGFESGSVFIYSAVTGEFFEKVLAPDGENYDYFGSSVCASDSHYVVGATGVDTYTGAAYLFQSSEE
eukprot:CAMPEP_0178952872 /NCGR_PEP_ID=MMETSP0789-20121207/8096_1 /TAXON_ID=3005 /ORGANISM="Rhizosolenia setigera, Strain CCMP 1694" /LENGTH=491 /DNA_ID=CAMNT_0020634051 /DNA_START=128 /DNA_END=1603 /DNA_ORIENTATION=+